MLPALTIGAYGALTLKLSDYGVRIDPAHLEVGLFRDARTAEDVLFLPAMTSGGYRRVVHGSGSSGPLP